MAQSQETTIKVLEMKIEALEKGQQEQQKLIEGLKSERDKALLWGIAALGTMVVSMGAWIVSLVKVPFK